MIQEGTATARYLKSATCQALPVMWTTAPEPPRGDLGQARWLRCSGPAWRHIPSSHFSWRWTSPSHSPQTARGGRLKITSPTWGCHSSESSSYAPPKATILVPQLVLKGKARPVLKSLCLPAMALISGQSKSARKGVGVGCYSLALQRRGARAKAGEGRWLMTGAWSWGHVSRTALQQRPAPAFLRLSYISPGQVIFLSLGLKLLICF